MANAIALQAAGKEIGRANSGIIGIEGMDDRDLVVPRIQLLQDKAVLLKNMQRQKIQAMAGQFVNTANELVPLDSVEFVPAFMTKFWDVYEISGEHKKWTGRVFSLTDPKLAGKRLRWEKIGDTNLKPEVVEVISVVAVVDGFPAKISFKGGSKQAGQELYTKAKKAARALYEIKYRLSSVEVASVNPFYSMRVEAIGEASEADVNVATSLLAAFAGRAETLLNSAGDEDNEVPF